MSVSELAPHLYNGVLHLEKQVQASSLGSQLIHLIKLRASQLNHCAYCVNMHTEEALADGIDPRKLYLLTVWEESSLYTERERAALAWTESVTLIAETGVPDEAFEAVRLPIRRNRGCGADSRDRHDQCLESYRGQLTHSSFIACRR